MDQPLSTPIGVIPSSDGASPAMAQWFEAKQAHPDALVFFRMGDFYELFFADAEAAAAALDIALTARGEHAGAPIAMCGVPVHAAENYLARLIRRGFRVAVAEQMEDPKLRKNAKVPIKRAVGTSLVAVGILAVPGTITHYLLGNVDVQLAALLIIGVIPGAVVGARITFGATDRFVRVGFAVLLAGVGLLLGASELGLLG